MTWPQDTYQEMPLPWCWFAVANEFIYVYQKIAINGAGKLL